MKQDTKKGFLKKKNCNHHLLALLLFDVKIMFFDEAQSGKRE
jgi:hypothetical protein